MRIYRGKEKIAVLRGGVDLSINFDHLFRFRGNRILRNLIDIQLGRIFMILGVGLVILPGMQALSEGNFSLRSYLEVPSAVYLVAYLGLYFLMYGLFLLRDKGEFAFDIAIMDLNKAMLKVDVGKVTELELENFFSEKVLGVIDAAYFQSNENFIEYISNFLLDAKITQNYLTKRLGVDYYDFRKTVVAEVRGLNFKDHYKEFFINSMEVAIRMQVSKINPLVLLSIFMSNYWKDSLKNYGVTEIEVNAIQSWIKNNLRHREYKKRWKTLSRLKPTGAINRSYTSRATPTVDEFGVDYTARAAKGAFVVSIGKDDVMAKVLGSLQKKSGAAVLVLGEPGVGKTHFLKYLATRMVIEDVPDRIKDMRLVVVDLNRAMAKSSSLDNFKGKLQMLLEEVVTAGNIILVFEEIGQIFGFRSEGRAEVVNLIANMIDEYNLKIIGTSNTDDYNKKIKNVTGFSSLFETYEIMEPKPDLAFQIVMDFVPTFEKEYGINIQVDSVKQIVKFSSKIIYEKVLPDKAIDLLEEAILLAKALGLKFLDGRVVDELFKQKVGVNIGSITENEAELLTNLENVMHMRIVGQDQAIDAIAAALRRSRSGLMGGKRPIASFLFYGPTGVGKTEVAKTLAETYYGDEKRMIRLNMSEYQEEENLRRLIGFRDQSGNFVEGIFTGKVKKNPFSLILLDELEKAYPKVLDLFLQVLDEGTISDGSGKNIDFTNTIIIATSNAGSREIADNLEKGFNYRQIEERVKDKLYDVYRVEFLNRFDKVIMFRGLNRVEIQQIAHLLLKGLNKKLSEQGIEIFWDEDTTKQIADLGYSRVFGARELRRTIQETIEDQLAKHIISKRIKGGSKVYFNGLNITKIL